MFPHMLTTPIVQTPLCLVMQINVLSATVSVQMPSVQHCNTGNNLFVVNNCYFSRDFLDQCRFKYNGMQSTWNIGNKCLEGVRGWNSVTVCSYFKSSSSSAGAQTNRLYSEIPILKILLDIKQAINKYTNWWINGRYKWKYD